MELNPLIIYNNLKSLKPYLPDIEYAIKFGLSPVWNLHNQKAHVDKAVAVEMAATLYRAGLMIREFLNARKLDDYPDISSLYRPQPVQASKSHHMSGMAIDLVSNGKKWNKATFVDFLAYWRVKTRSWKDYTVKVTMSGMTRNLDLAVDNLFLEYRDKHFNCLHIVPGFHYYDEITAPGRSRTVANNFINSNTSTRAANDPSEKAPANLKDRYPASTSLMYSLIVEGFRSAGLLEGILPVRN